MIIKSMSRKEPSFSQLVGYMSDEKSDRDYFLRHNVFARDPSDIANEFRRNSEHLNKRKNGNYMYHEILSIDTRKIGQGRDVKEALRLLALAYVEKRCSHNLVFGALHQDHAEHLHYHLMISANQRDEKKRLRLTRADFEKTKREIEALAIEKYPELKQELIIAAPTEKKIERRKQRENRKAQEIEKRGGRLSQREALAEGIRLLMKLARSQAEFEALLKEQGFEFYTRGKHVGIKKLDAGERAAGGKKTQSHRFATLKLDQDYLAFLDRCEAVRAQSEDSAEKSSAGEKEKGAEAEMSGKEAGTSHAREEAQEQVQAEPEQEEIDQRDIVEEDELSEIQKTWRKSIQEEREESAEREKDDPKHER